MVGTVILVFAAVVGVGAVIQGARRWRQGDRAAVLIPLGVLIVALLIWLGAVLIAPHTN